MSNDVYPAASASDVVRGLAFNVVKQPSFNTIVQQSPSGGTFRLGQMQNPMWEFRLIYEILFDDAAKINTGAGAIYTDLRTLMGFFLSHYGASNDFLFKDPDDNYMGPALIGASPNTLAQLQLVHNASGNYVTPLQRNLGGFFEDVTDLVSGTLKLYSNGTLVTNYTVYGPGFAATDGAFGGLYAQWSNIATPAPPTLSQVVSGALGARTLYAKVTYANAVGETVGSAEANFSVSANNVLKITSPASSPGATGWWPYVSNATGTERRQGSSAIAIGVDWQEPDTGFTTTGQLVPTTNAAPNVIEPITGEFNFYFRVRFKSDAQDFEKFVYNLWTVGGSQGKGGMGSLALVTSRPVTV